MYDDFEDYDDDEAQARPHSLAEILFAAGLVAVTGFAVTLPIATSGIGPAVAASVDAVALTTDETPTPSVTEAAANAIAGDASLPIARLSAPAIDSQSPRRPVQSATPAIREIPHLAAAAPGDVGPAPSPRFIPSSRARGKPFEAGPLNYLCPDSLRDSCALLRETVETLGGTCVPVPGALHCTLAARRDD